MKLSLGVLATMVLALPLGACSRNLMTAPSTAGPTATAASAIRSQFQVFAAAGDITPTVGAFRSALGNLNANVPGSLTTGRREINWDAVPAAFTNTDNFPGDFFNQPAVGRARGTEFTTPGDGFRVSDNDFADVNPDFKDQFHFFSPVRTFASVTSNVMSVAFFVPGSKVAATSTGFGVVFSDVDREGSASIRLFDANGTNLGQYLAPPSPSGVSFVGVTFPVAIVARVEITSGQGAITPEATDVSNRVRGPAQDLVIMDDFIYGEPVAPAGSATASLER